MATDIQSFDQGGIDLVYAVSQRALNLALLSYLQSNPINISWAFNSDVKGNLVPASDPSTAAYAFSGTFLPIYSITNNTVQVLTPVVDLTLGALNQNKVGFNITFAKGATFRYMENTIQQDDPTVKGNAWMVEMTAPLSASGIQDEANIPDRVKQQLALLNGQYDNVFSLSQVLADLSLAELQGQVSESDVPNNMGQLAYLTFVNCMLQYFMSNVAAGKLPLGYTITQSKPGGTTPTLTPTAADFVVVPAAAQQDPDLSALVFILMTGNNTLPSDPVSSFVNVNLFSNAATATGVAALRQGLLRQVIQNELTSANVLSAVSKYIQVNVDLNADPSVTFSLVSGTNTATPIAVTPSNANQGQILSFSFSQKGYASQSSTFSTDSGNSSMDSTFTVTLTSGTSDGSSGMTIAGQFLVSADTSTYSMGARQSTSHVMDPVAYPWTITYSISASATPAGQVSFVVSNSNFQETPVPQQMSGWDAFLESLDQAFSPFFVTDNLGGIRDTIQGQMTGALETALTTSMKSLGGFVFVGGNTFDFSNARVNNAYALLADINYTNP